MNIIVMKPLRGNGNIFNVVVGNSDCTMNGVLNVKVIIMNPNRKPFFIFFTVFCWNFRLNIILKKIKIV